MGETTAGAREVCANGWGRNTTTVNFCQWEPLRAQGAKVRVQGAKVRTSISASRSGMQQQHATPTSTTPTSSGCQVLCPSHKLWPIVTDVLMSQYCMCMIFLWHIIILYLFIFIWLLCDFYQFNFILYNLFSLLGATNYPMANSSPGEIRLPDTLYCSVLLSTIYTAFVYLIVRICTYVCTVCNTSCDKACYLKPPLEWSKQWWPTL